MLYLICTEDKNRPDIVSILDRHFEAYTVLQGEGRWRGVAEPSLTISIVTDDAYGVQDAAEEIKAWNAQESVMVVASTAEVTFI